MKKIEPASLEGYLFAKLERQGFRLEGPEYFLQLSNDAIERILKKARPWQNDKSLHKLLGEKVFVKGCPTTRGIDYVEVGPLESLTAPRAETVKKLRLGFSIIPDPLWLNRMPKVGKGTRQACELVLQATWPYRGEWKGLSSTAQIYDFVIEREGKEIWRWSEGRHFASVQTQVSIWGGAPYEYREVFSFDPQTLKEGKYLARAYFLPSRQSVERTLGAPG